MLSAHRLERLFRAGQFSQMLREMLENGLEVPFPLHVRLGQTAVAAVGLGLRRTLELSYGPRPETFIMARRLIHEQGEDGSFHGDPLATAVAAAALDALIEDSHTYSGMDAADRSELESTRDRALSALAGMQCEDGLFQYGDDRTDQDRALVAAFIAWQLASCDAFHATVRVADLFDWFDRNESRLDTATQRMWSLARAGVRAAPMVRVAA